MVYPDPYQPIFDNMTLLPRRDIKKTLTNLSLSGLETWYMEIRRMQARALELGCQQVTNTEPAYGSHILACLEKKTEGAKVQLESQKFCIT